MRLTLLKRPTLNRVAFILLFSAYIALFLNVAWYRQVLAVMPLHTAHNVLVFLSMPLVVISVINIVLVLASLVWLDKLLIALFIMLSASAQYFIHNYGIVVDR